MRKQLEQQLWRDRDLGVIEYIEGPTSSLSSIVVARKPKSRGKNHVDVSMHQQNRMIKEMTSDLNCSDLLSKMDLNQW